MNIYSQGPETSGQSMREMTRFIRISEGLIRNIVKRRLKLRSYKMGNGHFLSKEINSLIALKKCLMLLRRINLGLVPMKRSLQLSASETVKNLEKKILIWCGPEFAIRAKI